LTRLVYANRRAAFGSDKPIFVGKSRRFWQSEA
jgi:hypothetical protein